MDTLMTPTTFTPVEAVVGGLLVALSATLLMLSLGRIAGISGMLARATAMTPGPRAWPLAFLLAMILAAGVTFWFTPLSFPLREGFSPAWLVAGGLLVGYGTAMGSGCTSGHGVCGMARLSRRSIVATLVFMLTALVTVFVVRHFIGAGA